MGYPKFLEELINYLRKLPGVGEKTAERLSLSLIEQNKEDLNSLSILLKELPNKLFKCKLCNHLSENEI